MSGERGLKDAKPFQAPDDFRRSVNFYSLTGVAITRLWNGDWFYVVDTSGTTVTLPAVADEVGHHHYVKYTGSSGSCNIVPADGTAILDGSATHSIGTQYGLRCYFSDGAAWRGTLPPGSVASQNTWQSYSATATAGTGAFTSVATTGSFIKDGSRCDFKLTITNTTNGTAASFVKVNLPVAIVGRAVGVGRETTLTGKMVQGDIGNPDANSVGITYYDSSYPSGSGGVIIFSGSYECAP